MAFAGSRAFVGLGAGVVQLGLFAYEAQRAGNYAPPLLVDVRADLIGSVRADHGRVRVNVARNDRVDVAEIGPLRVADSSEPVELETVVEAIATADELATALPTVSAYRTSAANSPHRLIADGLRRRVRTTPLIVFCAENRRNAAAILRDATGESIDPSERAPILARARFVDTVIGKMGGVITDPDQVGREGLATITSGMPWACLVEEFDRILVSRVDPAGELQPGMAALREVNDLTPFEDAKLLGHNATHALGAFLGKLLGLSRFGDLRDVPGAMAFLRAAFIEESGRALVARYAGVGPPFTPAGFVDYADDLLARMVNPYLADSIERTARDLRRKLGWDDRLVGLMRLGLAQRVPTPRFAMGAAAGLELLRREGATGSDAQLLGDIWSSRPGDAEVESVLAVIAQGGDWLASWQRSGFNGLPDHV